MERNEIWAGLDRPWDVLVVGGGITGAGILREATRLGLRTLLVEKGDVLEAPVAPLAKQVFAFRAVAENQEVNVGPRAE